MSPDGSVTHWLGQLRAGDRTAARHLWERYFRLLVSRARAALANTPRRAADEEDVALSAFDSFCKGAEQGRFPNLDDRNDLWRLLLRLTARKAAHLRRDQKCLKRGGGKVVTEVDLVGPDAEGDEAAGLEAVIGAEPTPELAVQVAEEYRRLLDGLGDNELRSIAVWQMEGHTVEDIAAKMGRSARTVARKLAVIRERWLAAGLPS
jgi:DNA-directed RNA polymerase specialized sigma24 family protein